MELPDDRTVVLAVDGPIAPADVPGLCRRACALMDRPGVARVVCDVGALAHADGVVIDALARLQLAARRRGLRVALRHAAPELVELLALAGLSEVVPLEARGAAPTRRGGPRRRGRRPGRDRWA